MWGAFLVACANVPTGGLINSVLVNYSVNQMSELLSCKVNQNVHAPATVCKTD